MALQEDTQQHAENLSCCRDCRQYKRVEVRDGVEDETLACSIPSIIFSINLDLITLNH